MRNYLVAGVLPVFVALSCGQSSDEINTAHADSPQPISATPVEVAPEVTEVAEVTKVAETTEVVDVVDEVGAEDPASTDATIGVQKGDPNATVTIVEYFSPTCGACQQFHTKLMPMIQTEYVDTGKVIFEYRDYPLNQIDIAAYALARCTGTKEGYFAFIDDFFQNQAGIREAINAGAAKVALETVAKRHGIDGDEAFNACLEDMDIRGAITNAANAGREAGVSGTPTFVINGKLYRYSEVGLETTMREALDAALAETAPTDVAEEDKTTEE